MSTPKPPVSDSIRQWMVAVSPFINAAVAVYVTLANK